MLPYPEPPIRKPRPWLPAAIISAGIISAGIVIAGLVVGGAVLSNGNRADSNATTSVATANEYAALRNRTYSANEQVPANMALGTLNHRTWV